MTQPEIVDNVTSSFDRPIGIPNKPQFPLESLRTRSAMSKTLLLLTVSILLNPLLSPQTASAEDQAAKAGSEKAVGGKANSGKAAGIVIDRKDDWISIKVDGEDEPTKYVIGDTSDKKLSEVLKTLFSVSRVEFAYQSEGEARKLVSIKKQVPKPNGTITGEVVKNYGWWIEVKPKNGVAEGFACNFPFDKNQDMMDKLKELQEGDSVTLKFTTDFERHRIQTLHKNAAPAPKETSPETQAAKAKTEKQLPKDSGKVTGILIAKQPDWITVREDGEEKPVKYLVDLSDKKLEEAYKVVFNASRIQMTYKKVGDALHLASIKKQVLKPTGTVTGEVVKVHDNFWVEVKPKNAVADAFAPGANYNDKAFMEQLRGLKAGDSVTIVFTTDFERHRITSLRKNPATRIKAEVSPPVTK
ncbi:MAG: hypothetical protein JWM99_1787 [Verrucomicrobiales bacterium]|nr:hypothetical protein [Verrucomicrobiales bacterium]